MDTTVLEILHDLMMGTKLVELPGVYTIVNIYIFMNVDIHIYIHKYKNNDEIFRMKKSSTFNHCVAIQI